MVVSNRSRSEPEAARGGAFLASEVMLLAYHLSRISKEDILLYKLDRLSLSSSEPLDRSGGVGSGARSTSHIVRLHSSLQRHLEKTTMRLLAECADIDVVDIDIHRIARELEMFCVDNASVSLRRLKAMLYTGMQHFDRLAACLQLLLHLKDGGGPPALGGSPMAAEDAMDYMPEQSPASHKDDFKDVQQAPSPSVSDSSPFTAEEYTAASPDDRVSASVASQSGERPGEDSLTSRIITDRFEFAEIEESDLVSDILFVLQGVEGRFIKRDFYGRFTLTCDRKVSRGVRQLTNRICLLGQLYNNIVNAKVPSGLISQALYQAVMEQIHQYNRLVNLLVSGRTTEPLTLRTLYVWVQQPYTRMRLLSFALDGSLGFSLDHVFGLYCSRGDAMGRELYNELLRKCMIPYLEMLLKWVYFGELHDVSGVFFVKKVKDCYQLSLSKVPKFMSSSFARLCFDLGCCGSYCSQLKLTSAMKGTTDIMGMINKLCPEGPSWSPFVTVQRLDTILHSIDTSSKLAKLLINEYDFPGYMRRVQKHLGMECLVGDPNSEVFSDFELTKEYGFDIYVPMFSFPMNLVLDDENFNREMYISNFRLDFLLERSLKLLSICWNEYCWSSRCSHGSLDLSKRFHWINLCRNEMSHFCHVLQSGRSVQFVLRRFIASLSELGSVGSTVTLKDLRSEYSRALSRLQIDNFLETMEILECIVDYCKLVPRLFNRGSMQELRSLVREGASPSSIVDFIHSSIVTDEVMRALSHHARRFRDNLMALLHRVNSGDTEKRRVGTILDYNNFYRLLSVVQT
ncbi:hypothetical protein X943_004014 [Babesia divergens]|uniref:Spindle pole body component n=1 Tax=Babesia divergens TaxID=32595 RepID=A0AAD9GFR4_BABDI|nr:hypothetical protein X943_004014 [Babesia divergens]